VGLREEYNYGFVTSDGNAKPKTEHCRCPTS